MRITQTSDGYSIDPTAVRPGNPDALFARTIDATQKPPLIKAQEAVAAAVPRLIDSVPPPLLGGTLGLAVLGVMMASHHVRFKLAPVLTSAVLLLPVSNYHAAQEPAQVQHAEAEVMEAEEPRSFERYGQYRHHEEAAPVEFPDPPEVEEAPEPPDNFMIPPEITEGVVPLVEMVVPDEWTDEQQLRILRRRAERLMEEIRKLRLEQEIEERLERSSRRFQRL